MILRETEFGRVSTVRFTDDRSDREFLKYEEIGRIENMPKRIEIVQINRAARGSSMHWIRTCCQLSRSRRCHRAWKQYMLLDMSEHEVLPHMQLKHADRHVGGRGVTLHVI
ncbi:hypothetical protein F2Q70_00012099 [Brassica cretica]|uniref:Uncharacterized protein n=1 Tax=Brassica cretica TaxID=69181 RepID=A0A3N6UJ91_BRACR|nr:hypothetical protein F2Q70_00012099 [Brassica cretica]KAF3548140.1 hypothetical protein DY000_02007890 [Brassica cretica]